MENPETTLTASDVSMIVYAAEAAFKYGDFAKCPEVYDMLRDALHYSK